MEISVKLYTGELVKVFDTTIDKKKKVVLTTIKDFQRNAEVEIFNKKRKIKTLYFSNLPPVKAREIDLPVSIEVINKDFFTISYVDKDKKVRTHEVSLKEFKMKNLIKTIVPIAGIILLILLFIFLITSFIKNYDKIVNAIKIEKKEKPKKIKKEKIVKEEEKTEVKEVEKASIYTIDSLKNIISENQPIYFIPNEDNLLGGEETKLHNIAEYMKNYSEIKLKLNGHTESIDLPDNEYALSVKRTQRISELINAELTDINLDIETQGFGATQKVLENAPVEKQYLNRRVEIIVIDAK
jgi:outer membrane protein OmpA-like peptidoglycan-associated protein